MNIETMQGILYIAFAVLGIAAVCLFHHWDVEDRKSADDQREREDEERRMAARN